MVRSGCRRRKCAKKKVEVEVNLHVRSAVSDFEVAALIWCQLRKRMTEGRGREKPVLERAGEEENELGVSVAYIKNKFRNSVCPKWSDNLIWQNGRFRGLGWSWVEDKSFLKLIYFPMNPRMMYFEVMRENSTFRKTVKWGVSGASTNYKSNMKVSRNDLIYPLNLNQQFSNFPKYTSSFPKLQLGPSKCQTWLKSSRNFLKLPKHYCNL